MPLSEIDRPACFNHQLKKLIKKYKNSAKNINKDIDSIVKKPIQGDRIPRFGELHLRKLRIPLKEYKIGKSGGLRLIYLLNITENWIIMIAVYSKTDYKSEHSVQTMIKENLKSIKEEQ